MIVEWWAGQHSPASSAPSYKALNLAYQSLGTRSDWRNMALAANDIVVLVSEDPGKCCKLFQFGVHSTNCTERNIATWPISGTVARKYLNTYCACFSLSFFHVFFQLMFLTNEALFSLFLLISEMKWYFYILLNGTVSYACTDILQEQWLCNLHNSLKAHNGISNLATKRHITDIKLESNSSHILYFIIFTIFIPYRDILKTR